MRPSVRVVTSSESAARDTSATAAGIPSRALMQRAGAAAAAEIALRYRERLTGGVLVFAGPGNNGGDAWVVARALAASGVRVRVLQAADAKTPDCIAERSLAVEMTAPRNVLVSTPRDIAFEPAALIVDGLLGTGASGNPRDGVADAIARIAQRRAAGAIVVALDVPSGMNASDGSIGDPAVTADLTLTFGTVKRGHLVQRGHCGTIAVLDIGLGSHAELSDGVPVLVDERWVANVVPTIEAESHKGTRKKVAIIGGAEGMAGASILAARAAQRSGVGMVKLVVAPNSLAAVQEAEPTALAAQWPVNADDASAIGDWADAIVIGPGLGRSAASRALLECVLGNTRKPLVVDADAITLFHGNRGELARLLGGRAAILTPHPVEFARLAETSVDDVLARRFETATGTARELQATILLKGVPTVVTSCDGERMISASGTPALATAGSGDVLSGIAGTLLAQIGEPFTAAAAAAWVHGRAAERVPVTAEGVTRGISLDDVIAELRGSWAFDRSPTRYPVLVELPAVTR